MPLFPAYPTRRDLILDGIWDFVFVGDSDLDRLDPATLAFTDRMAVPGVFDASPAYAGRRGVACYHCLVTVSPGVTSQVHFGACGFNTRVFVDGQLVGACDLPYSGFAVTVPASDQAQRSLVVAVDNRFDPERQFLFEPWYDFYGYGGIYRPVRWLELPAAWWIERARISTRDLATGTIAVEVLLGGAVPASVPLRLACDDAPLVDHGLVAVSAGRAVVEMQVPDPRPWSPDSPVLHHLRIEAGDDAVVERFGLRTVVVDGPRLLLNGAPLKLKGYCRHEAHPQFGPALPPEQMVQDLQLMRAMGCNFIRGAHYPQDQRFLDLCDELGFLVWEEALGWGHQDQQWSRPGFRAANLAQIEAMIHNSYNHPCIIMWGFLNEGGSHLPETRSLYEDCFAVVRAADTTRPVTYASNRIFDGGHDAHFDLADIIALNTYPGWYAMEKDEPRPLAEIVPFLDHCRQTVATLGQGDKPFLISEIGAAALYGWRDPLQAHYSEEYQTDYLETVCREVMTNPAILGVALWQFCDCRTYAGARALGRPRTFNNKGSFDEYRRPKAAVRVVGRIFRDE